MGRVCQVCTHPQLAAINAALVSGDAMLPLAGVFGIHYDALRRHRREHLPKTLTQAHSAANSAEGDRLLEMARGLQAKTLTVLLDAEKKNDGKLVLLAVKEARGNLELLAKLLGEIKSGDRTTVNIGAVDARQVHVETNDIATMQALIIRALADYPEARERVILALEAGQ